MRDSRMTGNHRSEDAASLQRLLSLDALRPAIAGALDVREMFARKMHEI